MNVWARFAPTGDNFPSKKAFREAMRTNPQDVIFTTTSMFDSQTQFEGNHLPDNAVLMVVGPDPYRDRRWYANVRNGKVT